MVRASEMNNISYKKNQVMLSWIYVQCSKLFWINHMAARWYHQISCWVWMKGRFFEISFIVFVSASGPSFFLLFLAETSINWQDCSISFLGLLPHDPNFDCRDIFTYLFSWMDLIDCNRIILLHNIKPSCNCRQDWLF